MKFKLSILILSIVLPTLSGCGGGSGGDGGAAFGNGAGPAGSFGTSTVSFNPVLVFSGINDVTYQNTTANSSFPVATNPIAGTYWYVPDFGFETGTLNLRIPFTVNGTTTFRTFVGRCNRFSVTNNNITTFAIRFPEDNIFYPARVAGVLTTAVPVDLNSGDIGTGAESFTFETNGNISIGTTFRKTFTGGTDANNVSFSDLPVWLPGEVVEFSIGPTGALTFESNSVGTNLELIFAGESNGVITYGSFGTGTGEIYNAVFDTKATTAPSDFTIRFTDFFFTPPGSQVREFQN